MNWYKKAQHGDWAFGVYEDEAFRNFKNLYTLRSLVTIISSKKEFHPECSGAEDDRKTWNIRYIKFPIEMLGRVENLMRFGVWDGWYSMIWTNGEVRVIFSNGVRKLKNKGGGQTPEIDTQSLQSIKGLAEENGLSLDYMHQNLSGAMQSASGVLAEQPMQSQFSSNIRN